MKVTKGRLEGVLLIEPTSFIDERGFFLETYQLERYKSVGILDEFVQDNHSHSAQNVLRGMHYTKKHPQAQLLTVIRGVIFDVVVDMRKNSSSFGQWFGIELSDSGLKQIYMPHGFAHGFCVLSDFADLHYKVSAKYDPDDEGGLLWNDPDIGIVWPVMNPEISERDQQHPYFVDAVHI